MDFAHFVVQHVPVDKSILEEVESSSQKAADVLLQKKVISRRELMKLLTAYAKQESADSNNSE